MAVVNVTQMWSRDGGSVAGDPKDAYYRKYTRTTAFQVLVDDPETNLNDIENAEGIPAIGDLYPGSNIVYALRKRPIKRSPIFWEVDVEYEGDNALTNNRPIIKKSNVTASEPIDRDWTGAVIANVQGEAVEGITRDVSDTLVTITRNFLSINDDLVLDYLESTNSDTWTDGELVTYGPGRARLISYNADPVINPTTELLEYWKVTAAIQCRRGYGDVPPEKAWWKRYRNEGLYERIGPVVTISGGGGSGATAVANIRNGAIHSISVTNRGSGYTAAPTVTITTSLAGSGATATANLANDRVRSITVTNGGADYTGGLVRCVDDKQSPVTKPVLLKADGTREYQADNAIFLLAPVYGSLPYNALGLL